MSEISPQPYPDETGGEEYKIESCPNACYATDKEGYCVRQCDLLDVTVHGMFCEDGDC